MSVDTTRSTGPLDDHEAAATVARLTDRVATRLIEAIEQDAGDKVQSFRGASNTFLAGDERHQQLLVGAWISDEIADLNEERL